MELRNVFVLFANSKQFCWKFHIIHLVWRYSSTYYIFQSKE